MTEMTLAAVVRGLSPRADQPGVFSGYASLFGTADSQGDLVERGAFRSALEAWRAKGRRPAMLWQHDHAEPIGLWTHIEEDGTGLRVEGRLLLAVQAGAEAYEHLKAGTVTGLSIGYQAIESRRDRKTGLRMLSKVNLWEISLVTFPANDEARVASVKTDEEGRDRLAQALRRVFFTRPNLSFLKKKNAAAYLARHGRPQPRGEHARFVEDGIADARVTRVADRTVPAPDSLPATDRPMAAVEWRFIASEEGHQRLSGYKPAGDKSGVTIATGLDIGSHSEKDLWRMGVSQTTIDKLRPYFGLKGKAAKDKLAKESRDGRPLNLGLEEANELDRAKKKDIYEKVRSDFDKATESELGRGATKFDALDIHARTVILSVAFQYGDGLMKAAPKFWGYVTRQDWEGAIRELDNFKDAHPRRRKREAALLYRAIRGDMRP